MFESFASKTSAEWQKQIEKELKGKSFEETLVFNDPSGIAINPFYHSDQEIQITDYIKDSSVLKPVAGYFFKVEQNSSSDLDAFIQRSKDQGISNVCVWMDTTQKSLSDNSLIELIRKTSEGVKWYFTDVFSFDFPQSETLNWKGTKLDYVNTIPILETGGAALTELTYGFIALQRLLQSGVPHPIYWVMGIGKNYYTEIAKFRAARILFDRLKAHHHANAEVELVLHGVTGVHYWTGQDAHNNLLRAVTAGMSAMLGGCDELTIHPYDIHLQEPSFESYRWAHNIHHLLQHESYLDRIGDPVKGSYFLEYLTAQLVEKTHDRVNEIENEGHKVQDFLIQDRLSRKTRLQNKEEIIINVNKHVSTPPQICPKMANLYSKDWDILFDEDVILNNQN